MKWKAVNLKKTQTMKKSCYVLCLLRGDINKGNEIEVKDETPSLKIFYVYLKTYMKI